MKRIFVLFLLLFVAACGDDDPNKPANSLVNNANNQNSTNNTPSCTDDSECLADAGCYFGECVEKPAEVWQCWADRDCNGVCQDAIWCPADEQCIQASAPGICGCLVDSDCTTGQCYFAAECLAIPVEGSCYEDRDCPEGETCEGATFCNPGEDCAAGTEPGTCNQPQ